MIACEILSQGFKVRITTSHEHILWKSHRNGNDGGAIHTLRKGPKVMSTERWQTLVLAILLFIQGALIFMGVTFCYLAWNCTEWSTTRFWTGIAIAVVGVALAMINYLWHLRKIRSRDV